MDYQTVEKGGSARMLKNVPACADASAGRQMQQRAEGKDEGWRRDE